MRQVGIMSMQRIRNYGSSLQAYALKRTIESLGEGAEVSFLDYQPGPTLVPDAVHSSKLGRSLAKLWEYNDVDAGVVDRIRFFNHKRAYAAKYFPMLGIGEDPGAEFDLDVQVIGSDEVFNCFQSNTDVGYSRDLFGRHPRAPKVISYAGSFGNATLERINAAGLRADIEEDLAGLAAVSVRDRNSADIVGAICGKTPEVHVDPVIVYDWAHLEHRIPLERLVDDRYMIVYGYSGRLDQSENDLIRRHAREIGVQVICIGGVQACGDRFVDCDPFELFAYFRDAEAVITDTFHGTIFSLINHVPFGTIVRPTRGESYGNEEKLGFLLDTFGVMSRRLCDVADIARVLDIPIDADLVDSTIRHERSRSLAYLSREISNGSKPTA